MEPAKPLAELPEKRLRFTFRYQRWSDVLEWFAEQADLSLVLDAPPPGTFNYSDNRDYSASEALDLLNSVLLTKGYTLIRRERMLTLIDVSEQFPEGLIPKVTLEEVEKRGKHELVTVEFSLGRRDPEAVTAAVTPLLGPYHKLLPVAPTKQLFVTDRAGVMSEVQKVVQSIPETPLPVQPAVPPKPEPPQLKVYPIDKGDPDALMPILEKLVPTAQLVFDPNLNQLHANATPTQHAMIQTVLDQILTAASTDRERRVEVYRLDKPAPGAKVPEMFKAVVPKAAVSLKEDGTAVIVWASPAEHETIRAALDKLGGGPTGDPLTSPQLEIYRLTRVDPTKLITMLEKLVPDAKLSYDERSRSLIALAKPADQQAIRATLAQVQAEGDAQGADQPRFETYEVRAAGTAAGTAAGGEAMISQVQPLVPEAKITYDARTSRLVVYGTAAEQQLVKSALEKLGLEKATGDTRTMEAYPLAGADPTATQTLLQQLVPLAEFTPDATQQRLVALAAPADHERIKTTLEKLRPNPADPQSAQLRFYPYEQEPPAEVLELLGKVAPQAKITVDKDNERLMVLAPPTSQTAVETALQQFQQATPAKGKPELATYPIKSSDPASLLELLKVRYPKAQLVLDAPNKRLLVWASPEDQASLAASIQKLEAEPAAEQQPRFESYPLYGFATAAEAGTLVTSLQPLVAERPLHDRQQSQESDRLGDGQGTRDRPPGSGAAGPRPGSAEHAAVGSPSAGQSRRRHNAGPAAEARSRRPVDPGRQDQQPDRTGRARRSAADPRHAAAAAARLGRRRRSHRPLPSSGACAVRGPAEHPERNGAHRPADGRRGEQTADRGGDRGGPRGHPEDRRAIRVQHAARGTAQAGRLSRHGGSEETLRGRPAVAADRDAGPASPERRRPRLADRLGPAQRTDQDRRADQTAGARRAADRATAAGDLHLCGRRSHDDFHVRDNLVSRRQVRGRRQIAADPGLGSAAGSREDQARVGATGQRRNAGRFRTAVPVVSAVESGARGRGPDAAAAAARGQDLRRRDIQAGSWPGRARRIKR